MNRFRMLVALVGSVAVLVCAFSCDKRMPTPHGTSQRALIGGKPDTRHPAIGAMVSNLSAYCTGALITPRLVLTAAHCIESARLLQARGTRLQFRVDIPTKDSFQVRYYPVSSMHIHPQYSGSNAASRNQSDIGVAILSQNVPDVTPLRVLTRPMDTSWIGRKLAFFGYGLLQTKPQRKSAGRKHYLELTLREVQADRFKIEDKGKSICSGDSGGPALYEVRGKLRIVGVNSYVVGGREGDQPLCDGAGYAFRTDAYFTWLLPYMAQTGWKCDDADDCSACGGCQSGKCKPKPVSNAPKLCQPCQKDSDCGVGTPICATTPAGKRCTQPCDNDNCCPDGYSCQFLGPSIKQCFPADGSCPAAKCQNDEGCGPGEVCQAGTCTPKAVNPPSYRCRKCKSNADCQGGICHRFIDGGHCVQPCEGSLFCPRGDTCRQVQSQRLCLPEAGRCGCRNINDCHDGYRCRDGICQLGEGGKHGSQCNEQNPCAKEHLCLGAGEGTCVAVCPGTYPPGTPGSLCNDKKCLNDSRCYGVSGQSVCLSSCKSVGDCPFGGRCSTISGLQLCTCNKDSDCRQGAGCNKETVGSFGVCAPRASGNICPPGTACQRSVANTYLCEANDAKETGGFCDKGESCRWGLRCVNLGKATCARDCSRDGACQPEGGTCTQVPGALLCFCNDDKDCNTGHICQRNEGAKNGICAKAECQNGNDCPSGQRCEGGRCTKATKEAKPEPPSPEPTPQPDAGNDAKTPDAPKTGCQQTPPAQHHWLLVLLLIWLLPPRHRKA